MKKIQTPLSRSGGCSRAVRWFQSASKQLAVLALMMGATIGLTSKSAAAASLIIPTNQTWRYIVPTSTTFCLNGTGWETTGFDDSTWAGPSPGGFTGGETTAATVTSLAGWLNTTTLPAPNGATIQGTPYYFRTHFNLATTNGLTLLFTNRVDDQAVWYINGIRVAQVSHLNDPEVCPPGGTGGGEATTNFVFVLTPAQLGGIVVPGDNVLAVSVHQNAVGSSDLVFGTSMTGDIASPDSLLTITNSPTNATVAERGSVTFTVGASGSPQAYYWQSNGVFIAGANGPSYTIPSTPFSANGSTFRCMVSNAVNSPFSAAATLTVTPDTTAPTALVATASTNGTDIVLTFSEPMNPAYADTGAFLVYETGTDFTAGTPPISAIVIGNTIALTMGAALTDGVNYSVYIADVYDTSLGVPDPGNVLSPNPTFIPLRRDLLLIDFNGPNNIWRFSLETNLFGTGWETIGYDDSTWTSGPTGIGRDASANGVPIVTPAYPIADSSATFLRRNFFLPSSTVGVTLSIRHVFEDGAVVYINGVEAGRFNAPTGTLSVASRAPANAPDPTPISAVLPLSTAGLVAGDNLIAVVVLQTGATSSDMEFALELSANIGTFAAGPATIIVPPASQTVAEGANVSLSVVADGALPLTYQWSRNGSPILNATNASFSILGVLPSQGGNYRVLVSNGLGSTNSPIATLTVIDDSTPPAFVSAIGDVTLTNITLTIYDAFGLNIAAANNAANYTVVPTGAGAPVTVLTATLAGNGSNVVLTTTPRTVQQNYNATLSSNIRDRSEAANLTTPLTRPVVATIVIMSYNQVWKYDESGNNLGGTWSNVGYDDSLWPSGAGFLAFENSLAPLTLFTNLAGGNGTNTSLNLTNATLGGIGGTNITFYFRTTLNGLPFDPAAPGNTIRSTSYFDDGGVIYVNGGEQLRFNLTNSPVALNYTNLAVAGSTEGAGGLITSNLTGFVQANNTIAAEVHQNTLTSSDIAWGMQLEALVTAFSAGCPTVKIVDNGNGTVTLSWTGAATLQESTALQTPSASTVWVNSARVNGTPFTPSGVRFYRLSCP